MFMMLLKYTSWRAHLSWFIIGKRNVEQWLILESNKSRCVVNMIDALSPTQNPLVLQLFTHSRLVIGSSDRRVHLESSDWSVQLAEDHWSIYWMEPLDWSIQSHEHVVCGPGRSMFPTRYPKDSFRFPQDSRHWSKLPYNVQRWALRVDGPSFEWTSAFDNETCYSIQFILPRTC